MPRRRVGQEALGLEVAARSTTLERLHDLIDWSAAERALAPVHAAAKGEAAWPPLSLFKALLIAVWHDLSDVKLAEALDDRASFRRFCGFARHEAVPERTAFVRFRRELVRFGLDRALFEAVTRQLDAKGVAVRTGTLIDATVIASATREDGEAGWSGHQRRKAVHGYKAHVAADADTALVVEVAVTPGNVHDGRAGAAVIPDAPGRVYADSAYRGSRFAEAVTTRGGTAHVVATSFWSLPGDAEAERRFLARNAAIHGVRCRVEKVFGTWKRSYGLRRMRWKGLARSALQVRLTAIAYNLRRGLTMAEAG